VFHNTQKKEKKKKEGNGEPKKQQQKAELFPGHIDIRVGVVKSAEAHPDGDTLYVEKIDVGEAEPRTIVSGIKAHVPLEQFVGSRVLVMCNLKEKPLRGVPSNGMICCGQLALEDGSKKVRLLEVPDVAPGTRVEWGEGDQVAADPTPIAQKKLVKLLGQLKTDKDGAVVFGEKSIACHVGKEAVTCKELPNGVVG
jgi:tyrosyl-tRNA synthetase